MASNIIVIDVDADDIVAPVAPVAPAAHAAPSASVTPTVDDSEDVAFAHIDSGKDLDGLFVAFKQAAELNPFVARAYVNALLKKLAEDDDSDYEYQSEDDEDIEEEYADDAEDIEDDAEEEEGFDDEENDDDENSEDSNDESEDEERGPKLWSPSTLFVPAPAGFLVDLKGRVVPVSKFSHAQLARHNRKWMQLKAQRQKKQRALREAAQEKRREARRNRDEKEVTALMAYEKSPVLRYVVERLRRDIGEDRLRFEAVTREMVQRLVSDFYSIPEFCTVKEALQVAAKNEEEDVYALVDPLATTGKRKRTPTSVPYGSAPGPVVASSATSVVGRPPRSALKRDASEDTPKPRLKRVRYASALAVEEDGLTWPVSEDVTKSTWGEDRSRYAVVIEEMSSELFELLKHKLQKRLKLDDIGFRPAKRRRVEHTHKHCRHGRAKHPMQKIIERRRVQPAVLPTIALGLAYGVACAVIVSFMN